MYEFSLDNTERDKLYEFLFLLGCLRRCDYAASGNVKAEEITNFDIVYKDLEKNIKSNLKEIKEDMWQEELIKSIDSKNLILVAPTGSGKTEFSLLWAKKRGKKLVYTLPLRVALNDLYGRFNGTNENSKCPYFNPTEISILHSTSFVEFLKEKRSMEAIDIEEKVNSAKVFSLPILLTTADQVFLTSLKYYGFDKVLAIYPFTSFVIDEIQAYKPEMMAVIIKTIEMIHKMGGDILIMTATFPPYLNYLDSFISSSGSNIQFDFLDIEKTSIKNKVKNYSIKRHKIKVYDEPLFSYSENKLTINKPNIMKIMEDNKNANIMIVVNNVSKAISLYDDLKNNGNVHIIHSRILEKEKTKRIRDIKEDLKNHKKNIILVATQVVEASVDVDFDILITEISPIESQIQRWGRVWRNRDSDYNKEQPNVHIFLRIDKGTLAIYDKKILEETTRVLKEKDTEKEVLDYISERNLISKVYNENVLNEYMEQIMKNLQWLNYWSAEKRSVAQRIFRTIGGIQVVIPAIMKMSEDVVEKSFGMLLENEGNLHKMKWDDIIDEIKQQAHVERKISEWELKRILYENSVNIPIFAYEKIYLKDFKGFYILKIDDSETVNNIKEYGVNN
ncbi:MAG: CRISPR-associated helicase Cas3', partial [Candidatus Anstonellales archaeon]